MHRRISLTHDDTRYIREGKDWIRVRTARAADGAMGHSVRPVRLNMDLLMRGGFVARGEVDWFYRFLLWTCQITGIKRFVIWYRNLED